MLRFPLGVTNVDGFENENIERTVKVGRFGDKVKEVRLR